MSLDALAETLGATDRTGEARAQAGRWLVQAAGLGADIVTTGDESYPPRLQEIADPPVALWTRGPAPLGGRTVAIVGSRTATPAGLAMARQLSEALAGRGYTIVSGLAAGVDGAAHDAALKAGGTTVAVLGCGIDIVYPWRHRALAAGVATHGRLVSEYPPGTPPLPGHFPLRNRIISGLSQAVVVVEAARKSGSLSTARAALEQGRDVLAVPGNVLSGRYEGCHALIRDGARLVEGVRDIVEELEGVAAARDLEERGDKDLFISDLEPIMARTVEYSLDDLATRTGRPASELLADLGQLELQGRVVTTTRGRFVRP